MVEDTLIEFTKEHLMLHIILILMSAAAMIFAMVVDLVAGIKKARKNHQARTSTGYKKTCDKARKYFTPFMVLVCLDLIGCAVLPVPIFSMVWCAWCVFCEFKSVREKAWQKEEIRMDEKTQRVIIENKDDIVKMAVEIATKLVIPQEEKKKEKEDGDDH